MYQEYPFRFNDKDIFEGERQTFSDQLDEVCNLFGPQLKYIDVTHSQIDNIFGEHLSHVLERGIPLRLVCDQAEEDFYVEDSGMYTKFGYSPQLESATFHGSLNYFKYLDVVPQEDDLIYYQKVDKIFEITKVTLIDGFKYKIDTRLYNYSHEEIADDVTDVPILKLEDLADDEVEKIITPFTEQVESEDIVDISDGGDGLYG